MSKHRKPLSPVEKRLTIVVVFHVLCDICKPQMEDDEIFYLKVAKWFGTIVDSENFDELLDKLFAEAWMARCAGFANVRGCFAESIKEEMGYK